jgi:signal transduction histidine kinase
MFAIRFFAQKNSIERQFRFAGDFLNERDYFGEYLLHEAAGRIASDAFIQNRMASPFLGKEAVVQKIKQVSLSGYFNRYNVDVFLYSPTGDPLGVGDTTTFSDLISRYEKETFKTDYSDIYCVTSAQGYFSQKYIAFIPIQRNGNTVGHAVIELLLKRVIPKNVYPELLVDSRFQQAYGKGTLSYAIIANQEIQYNTGNFNYESMVLDNLDNPQLYSDGIVREKFLHVAQKDLNGRVAIISTPVAPLIHWVADFSFQVILGISLILVLLLMQGLFSYSLSRNLYLAARIQLILNLAFFLPLIAVSIITISLTTRSSQEQLNAEFQDKANSFGNSVAEILIHNGTNSNEVENEFTKLTTLADLDANVFGPNGKLVATTQPLIFENNLLAPYINPSAYNRIQKGERTFVVTEQVGNLKFYVAYSALVSQETGEQMGILTIPFFQSAASLEKMQITILSNIISIFTLVFIVLLMISFLVTRWLTAPLRLITETLGRISLLKANKPLQWQSNDEIGLLAHEYNQMLVKLNDSKQELERNQRERAWREIAQQVAHEIKNPLTPMKLTLQQLERSLESDGQQDARLNKALATLLSQVNSLDDIASSFSSFAKMPEPIMTEVDLVKLLAETSNLHAQEGTILFETKFERATVLADGQLLKRIFSNLILNGLQAARPNVKPEINIRLGKNDSCYQITISDNGKGIDSELVDKIFLPHFTTKQSGSGLGLAITKQGIEQMNGEIRFETSRTGTTFIIEIPQQKD